MHSIFKYLSLLSCSLLLIGHLAIAQLHTQTAVLVIGGGTGGTAAAIQSARLKVPTLLIEPSPWLGGMISAAGVSCTDGNHQLPSGIWQEFRLQLYQHYGTQSLATGWVSHTNFEPHVSNKVWQQLVKKEQWLTVMHGWQFVRCHMTNQQVTGAVFVHTQRKDSLYVDAQITIDATELGDVMANAGARFDVGMEADSINQENVGITESSNIIQDLTYVAILKDYGSKADCTIAKPIGYTPAEFDAACTNYYQNFSRQKPTVDALKMLNYGKLPNGKYMINWPKEGNDHYVNIINMTPDEREQALVAAKQTTLRFIYFIQTQLGFKNLGLADDEFPTADKLPFYPYHREGRRSKGLVRFTLPDIAQPFSQKTALYKTGIAVGDYPVDHHHRKNAMAPQHLSFYPVPSFNVPLGALIPEKTQGLIVAEKAISVSNVVNGTTRLQPVVMLTGQAAGVLAAMSYLQMKQPAAIQVRDVQATLLRQGAMIMPYLDVPPTDKHFIAIQKIGATGILKGKGIPKGWANETRFYPDSIANTQEVLTGLKAYFENVPSLSNRNLTMAELNSLLATLMKINPTEISAKVNQLLPDLKPDEPLSRRTVAILINDLLQPFERFPIDHAGMWKQQAE